MPYHKAIVRIEIDRALEKNLLLIKSCKAFFKTLNSDVVFLQISEMYRNMGLLGPLISFAYNIFPYCFSCAIGS